MVIMSLVVFIPFISSVHPIEVLGLSWSILVEHIEQAYAIRNQLSSYAVGCTKVAKSRFLCVKLVTTHGIELKYGITPILNCQNILNYNYMSQQII